MDDTKLVLADQDGLLLWEGFAPATWPEMPDFFLWSGRAFHFHSAGMEGADMTYRFAICPELLIACNYREDSAVDTKEGILRLEDRAGARRAEFPFGLAVAAGFSLSNAPLAVVYDGQRFIARAYHVFRTGPGVIVYRDLELPELGRYSD